MAFWNPQQHWKVFRFLRIPHFKKDIEINIVTAVPKVKAMLPGERAEPAPYCHPTVTGGDSSGGSPEPLYFRTALPPCPVELGHGALLFKISKHGRKLPLLDRVGLALEKDSDYLSMLTTV